MLLNGTNGLPDGVDGRHFLSGSPFRSGYFRAACVIGLCALVIDAFVLCRYWQTLNVYVALVLVVPIGLQLIYQWWRAMWYFSRIRNRYSMVSKENGIEDHPLEIALRFATRGLTDILFYCYGMLLVALVLIG